MRRILWIDNQQPDASRMMQIQAFAAVLRADARILCESGISSNLNDICPDIFVPGPSEQASRIASYIADGGYIAVFAPQSPHWLRVMSILAAACHAPFYSGLQTTDLSCISRTICANRLQETLETPSHPFVATVAQSPVGDISNPWNLSGALCAEPVCKPELTSFEAFQKELVSLDRARVVFAGGMGLGSKAWFDKLALCAKKYGAGLGASRLAVDLGWCRNDIQVGQTGRSIAPEVYVAFGISGAIQHLAGIQNARRILAINTDAHAPIFDYADTGIVGDAHDAIDRLLQ